MKSCTCHNCERAGLSASDYYHADTAISACVDSLMRGMDRNPFDETRKPCASVADIIATIETIYGKRAAYTSRFTEMPSIPGRFERDMSDFHNLHATIACKISINRNAALRTTVGGDVAVNAEK